MKLFNLVFTALVLSCVAVFASFGNVNAEPTIEYLDDVVLVTQADGSTETIPAEMYVAPAPAPALPLGDVPPAKWERVWDPLECVGPQPVGYCWAIDLDCAQDAENAFADAFAKAESDYFAEFAIHWATFIACEAACDPEDFDCLLDCHADLIENMEPATAAYDAALAAALAILNAADCCISVEC